MAFLPEIPLDSALARMFADERAQAEATWFSLPSGAVLFEAGEAGDQLYFLRAGRLGVFRAEEGQNPQFLGVIRPGEPAGEMALIAGSAHSAQVVALRDSEIFALPRAAFLAVAETDAQVMTELARLVLHRARQSAHASGAREPSVFGFITAGEGLVLRPLVERLARAIGELRYKVTVVGAEAMHAPTEWFSEVERTYDFVLYVAEAKDVGWRPIVARQVDRLFPVGLGDRDPPVTPASRPHTTVQAQQLVDLVLLQPGFRRRPEGSEAWIESATPARCFQVRRNHGEDERRLARVLTGQSVGLVLSGGGARAYAHVGAVRALRERGVPIDYVGGASMGAVVAAGVAMGWDDDELSRRIREAFVDSSPLDDIALPLLAMTHGTKVAERLAHHFGDTEISDLWLPFFCVSSNLTTGAYHLHRRGRLRDALRASISLPGVLPPATDGQNVLVDGAVMKNFPADIMRMNHLGPIIGIDVTRGRSITADDVARPESVWRWIRSGQWRKGPPIVSLLMRAATVSSSRDLAAAREATDLLVTPEVTGVEIRDWAAFEPAAKAGYEAMIAALDRLTTPVTELRRHTSTAEAAPTPRPVPTPA